MADVVLSAKMSDQELLNSIDDTLGKAQTKFDNFTKGINTNLGKVNSIPNGALGVNEFKQATDALESYRKKQDDISKAWADFEGKNSRIADAQSRIVEQKEKERLAQEKINELREKEINAAWQQKDSQDANIRIKSEQQLQKEIEQGQKAVQQRQRESDRASEKERSNILSQIDKEKELARIQDERKRQTSILESLKTGNINLGDESYRLGDLKEMRDIAASYRNSLTEGSSELNKMNGIYQQLVLKIKDAENTERSKAILMEKQNLETAKSMPETNIAESENKLKRLLELKQRVESQNLFNEKEINSVNNAITRVNKNIEKLKLTSAKTTSMSDIFGMSEKTLNDVASKMKAISEYRMNFGAGSSQLSSLNKEYERLAEVQKKSLTQGVELEKGNSKLAASWTNLFRRVAFYASLGAFTGFMKSMVSVRAEFEMTERSLGALLGSWEKGTDLFNKIQANALKSPFSILELSQSAKQLIAYNFAESEVVETTKRLADISSALGVPMERLVYNLGQIKAQGVLTARDARDFANAGLAIVPMLAKMYTEQKRFGNVAVTTAKVYDMMTKKMVSYNDVMSVVNKLTDEGGMFFDFQAKQAETLNGKLSNLGDAYDLMLNQMGQDNSGFINGTVSVITTLVRNWKSVEKALLGVVFAVGLYKSAAISTAIINRLNGISEAIQSYKILTTATNSAKIATLGYGAALRSIALTNPFGLALVAATALVSVLGLLNNEAKNLDENIKTFGETSGTTLNKVDTLYKTIKGTTEGTGVYKKAISELNTILDEYGIRNIREIDNLDEINKKREQAIELIKTEGIERERANALEEASKQYTDKLSKAKTQLISELQGAMTEGLLVSANDEIRKNAQPIASVVASIVSENIDLIANKQGEAYEDGMGEIFSKIQDSMRKMGLSEEVISKSWLTNTFGHHTNIIKNYLEPVKEAKEEYNNWTNNVENWANAAKRATDSTMTFKQKTDATNRALQKQTESVHDLYKNIKNLMSQYSDNTIGFTINVGGDVPEWMMGKKVSELERLAKLFASAGKNAKGGKKGGAKVNGVSYSQQELLQRGADYATAAERKQLKIEQDLANKKGDRVDYQLQAIEKELQLIDKLRKGYDDLKKAGYSAADAKGILAEQFAQNIKTVNSMLNKFGIAPINMARVAGASDTAIKKLLESQMSKLSSVAAKDKASLTIGELSFNAAKINITEINKELQDNFNEIKSSFELGIEIEENPELGGIFANLFNVDMSDFAKTAREVVKKMQDEVDNALILYNKDNKNKLGGFDILQTNAQDWAKQFGIDPTSDLFNGLTKGQKDSRELLVKEFTETNKVLEDYVSKYGDYSDKIQKIERERLQNINKLNDFYNTETLKQSSDYITRLNAINEGASRQKTDVKLDEFKNSELYIKMFENLDYVSTATLKKLKEKLTDLKSSMGKLEPEQLKQITEQFNKIDSELVSRDPFDGLIKNIGDYIKALKNKKQNEKKYLKADDEYQAQKDKVAAIKEQIEANKANKDGTVEIDQKLKGQLKTEQEILDAKKRQKDATGEQLTATEKVMKTTGEAMGNVANKVSQVADAAVSIRDDLKSVGVDFGDNVNGAIDGFAKASEGLSKVVTSLESGDVMGVIAGLVKATIGQGQMFASIFDGNKKDYFTGMKESLEKLEDAINTANDSLNEMMGNAVGSKALSYYKDIVKNNEDLQKSYRDLAKATGKSGSSWGSHSYAYRTNKSLKNDFDDISKLVGKNITSIQDMYNLSSDQLKLIRDRMPIAWNNIDSGIQSALQKVIEYGDASKEAIGKLGEALTGISLENISSDFASMLSNMDSSAEDFSKQFENYMRNAIVRTIVYGDSFQKQMEEWYKTFQNSMSDGSLDLAEKQALQEKYNLITEEAKKNLDAALAASGLSGKDGTSASLSSLQQGIQGVTETTAGAVEGYMNNLTQQNYLQSSLMQNLVNNSNVSLGTQSQMLLQLQQGYQVQLAIQGILQGWSSNSGRSVKVQIVD